MALACIIACSKSTTTVNEQTLADTIHKESQESPGQVTEYDSPEKNEFMEFGATKEGMSIRLRDWWKEVDQAKLGNPIDTSMELMGLGADTHVGASMHKFRYKDIQLHFYGPKDGQDIWLNKIEITGSGWSTARGIHVGDSLSDLSTLYPKAENQTTNDPNLFRYQLEDSQIEFHTRDNVISQIDINYNIP